jgi:hypothetical protein
MRLPSRALIAGQYFNQKSGFPVDALREFLGLLKTSSIKKGELFWQTVGLGLLPSTGMIRARQISMMTF